MEREKGIAYCGLACAVCSENSDCPGCRNDGCKEKEWCKNFVCCRAKGLSGCWECEDFPCPGSMTDKIRIRTFAKFIRENGEERLLDCLEKNEKAGIVYHNPGELSGDYDIPTTEKGITRLILTGEFPEK